jgi:hypothetical protein
LILKAVPEFVLRHDEIVQGLIVLAYIIINDRIFPFLLF